MGKNYMNSDQKQTFVIMSAAGSFIGQALDTTEKYMPKTVAADIKRSRTFLFKALAEWIKPMDEKSKVQVTRIAKDVNLGIINNRTRQLDHETYQRYLFGKEQVMDLAEVTWQARCSTCDGACRDSCSLYEAYRHFDIEPLDPKHPKCEFSGVTV